MADRPPSEPGSTPRATYSAGRTRVSLACPDCGARNYKTTRKPDLIGQLSFKKFCPTCKRHTEHKETK
jgi:large subunit ribosomal protein L33